MKPYSKDLRTRVLAAVDRGEPRGEVAKIFSVSVPTIKRWLKRRRETGGVEVIPIPGRPRVKGAALERWLPENTCPTTTTLPSKSTAKRAPRSV